MRLNVAAAEPAPHPPAARSVSIRGCAACECRFSDRCKESIKLPGFCTDCESHPKAIAMARKVAGSTTQGSKVTTLQPATSPRPEAPAETAGPRPFTVSDRSMIRRLHGYLPTQSLLDVLNERLAADIGEKAPRYTMEQLHAELRNLGANTGGPTDWAGLRKLIANARENGTLARVTPQMIDDFAVIFQLSPAQVIRAKDVLLSAKNDHELGDEE